MPIIQYTYMPLLRQSKCLSYTSDRLMLILPTVSENMAAQLRMLHVTQDLVEDELEALNALMLVCNNAERLGDYYIQQQNLERISSQIRTARRLLENIRRFIFEEELRRQDEE